MRCKDVHEIYNAFMIHFSNTSLYVFFRNRAKKKEWRLIDSHFVFFQIFCIYI